MLNFQTLGKALVKAAENGNNDTVNALLLQSGAQLSAEDIGSAFIRAARNNQIKVIRTLLTLAGAQISDEDKVTALYEANQNNHYNAVNTIITELSPKELSSILEWAVNHELAANQWGSENSFQAVRQIIVNYVLERIKQKAYCSAILETFLPKVLVSITLEYQFGFIDPLLCLLPKDLADKVGLSKTKIDEVTLISTQQNSVPNNEGIAIPVVSSSSASAPRVLNQSKAVQEYKKRKCS